MLLTFNAYDSPRSDIDSMGCASARKQSSERRRIPFAKGSGKRDLKRSAHGPDREFEELEEALNAVGSGRLLPPRICPRSHVSAIFSMTSHDYIQQHREGTDMVRAASRATKQQPDRFSVT